MLLAYSAKLTTTMYNICSNVCVWCRIYNAVLEIHAYMKMYDQSKISDKKRERKKKELPDYILLYIRRKKDTPKCVYSDTIGPEFFSVTHTDTHTHVTACT